MDRYRVTPAMDADGFMILDRESYDFCGLPDENGRVRPLQWTTRGSAEAWLNQCYRSWAQWEGNGKGTAPKGWRPRRPETSPFDRGHRFYN
jgi:hypothetical protein